MADRQLVYIDESGDAGFKVGEGSSPTFIVAAAIFQCGADAEKTANAIHWYRSEVLGKGRNFEFHFTNLKRDWRIGFLKVAAKCPFTIRAIVMQKDRIWDGTQLKQNSSYFYNYTVGMLLRHTFGQISDAKLFLDGEAGRKSLREMIKYLRKKCNTGEEKVFHDIKFVRKQEGNVLVQLADMVTGAIARSYLEDKKDRHDYRRIIKPQVKDVFEFGYPKGEN
ncbi:MAG: DUF3800 domain-containing protein [Armatimonadota bacterium]|jgi:hypothetical protein